MTFSAKIKEELCNLPIKTSESALAEFCGIILFANATKNSKIKIVTENKDVAHRASWLLKSLFGYDFDKKSGIVKDQCLCYTCNTFCSAKGTKFKKAAEQKK